MSDSNRQTANSDSPSFVNVPFRIRMGVTGHRKLPDEKALAEKIHRLMRLFIEVIEAIKKGENPRQSDEPLKKDLYRLFGEDSRRAMHPSPNTPIAFSLITPLAEGADRLVAKEALKFPDFRIEVVLPLIKKDYSEDFETLESRQEFEELLGKARRPFTLKKYTLRSEFSEGELKEARRQAYEDVGRYVVNHCDILIALWDGEESRGKGGTAEIVGYAAQKKRPVIILSTKDPYKITVQAEVGFPLRTIEQIEMFNSYPVPEDTQRKYVNNLYRELFDHKGEDAFPEETSKLVKENILPYYVRASLIAKRYQKLYLRAGTFTYVLAAIAIAAVAIGIMIFRLSPYAYLLEFLCLITIYLLITYANRKKVHKKWIENRFLAERIRSAQFFILCGIEISGIEIPPYMGTAHQPDDWMVRVFHEIWNKLPALKGCKTHNLQQLSGYIYKHWIDDQIKYHEKKKASSGEKSKLFERTGFALFLIAMIVALVHAISHFRINEPHHSVLNHTLTFFAIVLPVVGAVLGSIRAHREYSRLEKRSLNMEIALRDTKERYLPIDSRQKLESFMRETDELMLRETQDWLMLMKFVELKPEA